MKTINIQFHMTLNELLVFVSDVRSRFHLDIEFERFSPKCTKLLSSDSLVMEEADRFGQIDRVWLIYNSAKRRNPERFMLNVGAKRGKRLSQGQLGAGAASSEAFNVLKAIVSELKLRSTEGVWVVTESGNAAFVRGYRVSPQAAAESRSGETELVSQAFTQLFLVDPPTS